MEAGRQRVEWVPAAHQGWVAPHLAAEFPGLGIAWSEVDCRPGRSPEPVRHRLRGLSDRFYGSHAVHMRERRSALRGPHPPRDRTPGERLALERLEDGAFKSRGMPRDALTIAIVETGVALRAFDADALEGGLCIRDSAPGEALAGSGQLAQGTLIVADDRGPVAVLFGPQAGDRGVERRSRRVAVVATQVDGVPQIAVGEALWMAAATLESA